MKDPTTMQEPAMHMQPVQYQKNKKYIKKGKLHSCKMHNASSRVARRLLNQKDAPEVIDQRAVCGFYFSGSIPNPPGKYARVE